MYIAQQIAAQAVHQVLSGHNLTLALPAAIRKFPDITPQQRGTAQDLSYGTLRFYGEINAYLTQLLEKPLTNEGVRCLLLVAIYQLLHDKAQAFTVVDQAVTAATQFKTAWAKGLVNAVLRNFLRQKEELAKKITNNELATYSYPQWWINKIKVQYPSHWQSILAVGNQHPPMTLRINRLKTNMRDYLIELQNEAIEASVLSDSAVMLAKPILVEKIPQFLDGGVSVQDYGAQIAAHLLDVQDGMRVLDACCAPGGKTAHILEVADVAMTALDSDADRLLKVQGNLERLNLHAELMCGDASYVNDWWDGVPFDRVLSDVPCTASGIVRRHVDIKWLRREADVASFAKQQALILCDLWQTLAKGGKLLYVTCSIFNEENQGQIDRFLQVHADATQLPWTLPTVALSEADNVATLKMVPLEIENGQLIPTDAHDGFFYALLQKN